MCVHSETLVTQWKDSLCVCLSNLIHSLVDYCLLLSFYGQNNGGVYVTLSILHTHTHTQTAYFLVYFLFTGNLYLPVYLVDTASFFYTHKKIQSSTHCSYMWYRKKIQNRWMYWWSVKCSYCVFLSLTDAFHLHNNSIPSFFNINNYKMFTIRKDTQSSNLQQVYKICLRLNFIGPSAVNACSALQLTVVWFIYRCISIN